MNPATNCSIRQRDSEFSIQCHCVTSNGVHARLVYGYSQNAHSFSYEGGLIFERTAWCLTQIPMPRGLLPSVSFAGLLRTSRRTELTR
jgi:hypothetical protein